MSKPKKNNAFALDERRSGILLHPTSLPGPYGIGDLGPEAYRFVDFLKKSGARFWQMLPVTPPGGGDSPYQSPSSFAGNFLMISPELLVRDRLLTDGEARAPSNLAGEKVDYAAVRAYKTGLLKIAFGRFQKIRSGKLKTDFNLFLTQHKSWLTDYARFSVAEELHDYRAWTEWPDEFRTRKKEALGAFDRTHRNALASQRFIQFIFERQWQALRAYAHSKDVGLIGDLPIFTALQSSDVWAHPELFHLDERGNPTTVAGVPPDYFSKTGQRWGNPLYRWETHEKDGFAWWARRLKRSIERFDVVRLDHFIGFERYWEIPAAEETAVGGRFVPGPTHRFFDAITETLGPIPIIAEDLGIVTPEVTALRLRFGFPGMRVLEFAFDGKADNDSLPENVPARSVYYTGTHDNDTVVGWFNSLDAGTKEIVSRRMSVSKEKETHWALIDLAFSSKAQTVMVPAQDLLGLGSEARMNTPGTPEGNWRWRAKKGAFSAALSSKFLRLGKSHARMPR